MIDLRERVLEHALRELLAPEAEIDLAPRIVAAWERGLRGWRLDDELLAAAAAPPLARGGARGAPRRLRHPRLVLGAAALVLSCVAAGIFLRGDESAAPSLPTPLVARSATPVALLRGGELLAERELRAGDLLLGPAGAAGGIELVLGGRIELGDGALAAIDPGDAPSVRLHSGELSLAAAPSHVLVLDAGVAQLFVEPGARAHARLVHEGAGLGGLDAPAALALLAAAPGPRRLELRVEQGWAKLAWAGSEERLGPKAQRALASPGAPERTRTVDDDARVRALCALLEVEVEPSFFAGAWRMEVADEILEQIAGFLAVGPERARFFESCARSLFGGDGADGFARAILLDALLLDPAPDALELVDELWTLSPAGFGDDHLLRLAELGEPVFRRELLARADDESLAPAERVLPLAWLMLQGDERGRALLGRVLETPVLMDGGLGRSLAAAHALRRRGDEQPWRRVLAGMRDLAFSYLEQGRRDLAARQLARIAYLDESARTGGLDRLAFLEWRVNRRALEAADESLEPEELERRLRALVPW